MTKTVLAGAVVLAGIMAGPAVADVTADFELGAAWVGRNDQAIPGTDGTRFSLVRDLHTPLLPAYRARLGWGISERMHASALISPLRSVSRGSFDRDVSFAGTVFAAGKPVAAVYRFDSYRLTWRYRVAKSAEWELWAGLTGKLRDAEVTVVGEATASKLNTGFVPLLNIRAAWNPGGGSAGLLLDADAAAAPQGRAEDVLVAFTLRLNEGLTGRIGYRMLEGGADVDEVFNMALVHYAVTGLEARF